MLLGPAFALLLLASPPPPEQRTSPPQPRPIETYDDQMRELPGVLRRRGLSDAGIRIVIDSMRSEQADIEDAARRISEPANALRAAAEAARFDPEAFEASFRRYVSAQARVWTISADHALAMFRALSPDDQKIMARLMAGTGDVRIGMPIRPLRKTGP
ncbi:MAG TPA: periplasmic heavy metal sensor [Allosphingosinicella sp.]|nr:periplasmic heavy metal sensor [Allosphingosinicella sp.]